MGDVHAEKAPLSIRHSNVAVVSGLLKSNEGVLSLLGSDGVAVIVVSGAVVSTTQVWESGVASVLPALSMARTSVWCQKK